MVKSLLLIVLGLVLYGCNIVQWNQKRLSNKFNRNGIEESFFVSETDSIHYFEGGQGETILLLHGFGGDAQVTWNKSILDLTTDYHIICPDLIWFGESVSTRDPNLQSQVDGMWDLIKSKTQDPIHIAGISYGGFVTLGMQSAMPNKIKSMCIIDSPGYTFDVNQIDSLCASQGVKNVSEIFVLQSPENLQRLTNLAVYKDRKIPSGMLKDMYEAYFTKNHEELRKLLSSLLENYELLKSEAPTTFPKSIVIWGEKDEVFNLSEGKKIAAFLGAEIKIIPNVGHAPNIENFKVFESIYRSFLETVE